MGDLITILGLCAGACTTLAFIPQVIKVFKSKSVQAISTGMYIIFCLGLLLWVGYGVILKDLPLVIANSITLVLALMILIMRFKYK
jgi:MtN3 and saliva related transmembrane protein